MSVRDLLKGTGVALVTPFTKGGEVDHEALTRVIQFVLDGGVEYLVTLGTTGETPTLSKEEKRAVVDTTFSASGGRVPVVVGVGGNNTRELLRELDYLAPDRAAALLSASPNYNKPSQEGIYRHYAELSGATAKPILLYNVPGRTGSNMTAETVLRLARDFTNIVGIKEASGNLVQAMHILRAKPQEFMVVSGDDHLALAGIACGMLGVISVAANTFPRDFSALVRAALSGDLTTARRLNHRLLPGYDLLFAENNPAGAKGFLSAMGLIENELRLPLVPLSAGVQEAAEAYLQTLSTSHAQDA